MGKCHDWKKWLTYCKHGINRNEKRIDHSLYLVTDDKFVRDRNNVCPFFLNKIVESVLGGVSLVQLRIKELSDIYFYNLIIEVKEKLRPFSVPIIINDRVDMCLSTEVDGVHVGKTDIPLPVVRRVIGKDKLIGGTINFSDEKDVELAVNNNLNYIVHEQTLYKSMTKKTKLVNILKMKNELETLNKIFDRLQQKGKIQKGVTLPPRVLIGGINTENIEDTMKHFHDTCDGVAVVSAIIGKDKNSFLNALQMKFVLEKYKQEEHVALLNMFNRCLNFSLYKMEIGKKEEMENAVEIKNQHIPTKLGTIHEEKANKVIDWNICSYVCTHISLKEYVYHSLLQNIQSFPIRECINMIERIHFYLFDSKILPSGEQRDAMNESGAGTHTQNFFSKWVKEMKQKQIKNKVFICIGEEIFNCLWKEFSTDAFQSHFHILIENAPSGKPAASILPSLPIQPVGEYEMKEALIKYDSHCMKIILKSPFFPTDHKCRIVGVWLMVLLHIHAVRTPQILSNIIMENNTDIIKRDLLKYLSAATTAITNAHKE